MSCINLGTPEQENALRETLAGLKDTGGAVMPALQRAQEIYGYLPIRVQECVAAAFGLPLEEVYGVSTFYSNFRLQAIGKYKVSVCLGTACYVRGGKRVVEALQQKLGIDLNETTEDGLFTLEVARCIGACGLAPAMMIDDAVYKQVNVNKLDAILAGFKKAEGGAAA